MATITEKTPLKSWIPIINSNTTTSKEASTTASSALNTANTAVSKADAAQSSADSAMAAATAAQSRADTAATAAERKATETVFGNVQLTNDYTSGGLAENSIASSPTAVNRLFDDVLAAANQAANSSDVITDSAAAQLSASISNLSIRVDGIEDDVVENSVAVDELTTKVADVEEDTQLIEGRSYKPGDIVWYAGNGTPAGRRLPGWTGAAVSRTTYADLFAAIGTTYGAGDGSTTFNLPNLTDKFIQGSGTAGTVKEAGAPDIRAEFSMNSRSGASRPPAIFGLAGAFYEVSSQLTDVSTAYRMTEDYYGRNIYKFSASKFNSIYGASTTVQPPALTMRPYIVY